MNRVCRILIFSLMTCLWGQAFAQPINEYSKTLVAVPGNIFSHLQDGKPEGVFLSLTTKALAACGYDQKFVTMPTGDAVRGVAEGTVDVATVVVPTEAARKNSLLSQPLFVENNVVLARSDSVFVLDKLSDLSGRRIALKQGFRYPLIEKRTDMQLIYFRSDGEMLRSVLFGKSDVAVVSAVSDVFKLRSEGVMSRLTLLQKSLGTVPFVASFSRKKFSEQDVKCFDEKITHFKSSNDWIFILEKIGMSDLFHDWVQVKEE